MIGPRFGGAVTDAGRWFKHAIDNKMTVDDLKLEHPVRQGNRPFPRCRTEAYRQFRASWPASRKARQCEPSSRLCKVASIAGSALPRPIRRPARRAAMTLLSLTTRQSPARSRSGRSPMLRSSSSGAAPFGRTTRSRAASRGTTGRKAMRSAGRSKSKRSVRMAIDHRHSGACAQRTNRNPEPCSVLVSGFRVRPCGGRPGMTNSYAPIVALTILSGSLTGSPRLILSTFSMPSVTLPQTVY